MHIAYSVLHWIRDQINNDIIKNVIKNEYENISFKKHGSSTPIPIFQDATFEQRFNTFIYPSTHSHILCFHFYFIFIYLLSMFVLVLNQSH